MQIESGCRHQVKERGIRLSLLAFIRESKNLRPRFRTFWTSKAEETTWMRDSIKSWMRSVKPSRATVHWTVAFRWVRIPFTQQYKKPNHGSGRAFYGRGWGIRTPANGVRVRCATVTQILYLRNNIIIRIFLKKSSTFFLFRKNFSRAVIAYPGEDKIIRLLCGEPHRWSWK